MKKKNDTRKFFHYTGYRGAAGILRSGQINLGKSPFSERGRKIFVCLTTDKSPNGHGLTEGETVYPGSSNFHHLVATSGARADTAFIRLANLKNIRLTVEINKDDRLLRHWDKIEKAYRQRASTEDKNLGVLALKHSASYPIGSSHISNSQLRNELSLLSQGRFLDKSHSWWFYADVIQAECITRIERRVNGDIYEPLSIDCLSELEALDELEHKDWS